MWKDTERLLCDNDTKIELYAISQGTAKTSGKPPESRKKQGRIPERTLPCQHLDFALLALRTVSISFYCFLYIFSIDA
jgi:hypothetical protein